LFIYPRHFDDACIYPSGQVDPFSILQDDACIYPSGQVDPFSILQDDACLFTRGIWMMLGYLREAFHFVFEMMIGLFKKYDLS
jgi:hypothetical protein